MWCYRRVKVPGSPLKLRCSFGTLPILFAASSCQSLHRPWSVPHDNTTFVVMQTQLREEASVLRLSLFISSCIGHVAGSLTDGARSTEPERMRRSRWPLPSGHAVVDAFPSVMSAEADLGHDFGAHSYPRPVIEGFAYQDRPRTPVCPSAPLHFTFRAQLTR